MSLHGWVREGGFANSLHWDGCPPGAKQRPPEGAARVAACVARDPSAGQREGGRAGREGRDGSLRPWPECVVLVRGRGSAQVPRRSPEAPRVHSGWRTLGPAPAGSTSGQRAAQGAWLVPGKKACLFLSCRIPVLAHLPFPSPGERDCGEVRGEAQDGWSQESRRTEQAAEASTAGAREALC